METELEYFTKTVYNSHARFQKVCTRTEFSITLNLRRCGFRTAAMYACMAKKVTARFVRYKAGIAYQQGKMVPKVVKSLSKMSNMSMSAMMC